MIDKTKQIIFTYVITNKINGKQYVGMHMTQDIDDDYMGSGTRLRSAILKYGVGNFVKNILYYYEDAMIAHLHEGVLIRLYSSLCPDGYNINPSGGRKPIEYSDESRCKMGKSRFGKDNPFYGQKHTDKTRKKISDRVAGRKQSESEIQHRVESLTGQRRTLEQKEKIYRNHNYEKSNPPMSEGAKRKLSDLNKDKPWSESRRLAEEDKKKKVSLANSLDIVCDHYQICHHNKMRDINKSLQECFSLRSLGKEFNVSRHILSHHRKQCLSRC